MKQRHHFVGQVESIIDHFIEIIGAGRIAVRSVGLFDLIHGPAADDLIAQKYPGLVTGKVDIDPVGFSGVLSK